MTRKNLRVRVQTALQRLTSTSSCSSERGNDEAVIPPIAKRGREEDERERRARAECEAVGLFERLVRIENGFDKT